MIQTTDYFTVEEQGDICVLRLRPLDEALTSLKRACRHIDKDLATYLRNSRTGFNNLPG